MLCRNCDRETLEGASFCTHCGNPLRHSCPSCEASNPQESAFCYACGESLMAEASQGPEAPVRPPEAYWIEEAYKDGDPFGVEEPTRPGEEPTRPGEEPTRPGEEPTRPGEEPTRPGEEPTRPGEEPTRPGEEPTRPGEEPTRPGEEPTRPGEEPTRPGEEPTRPGEEPTRPGEEPTRPGEEPTRPGEEPTRPGEEPTRPGEEPTRPGEEPTRPGEEPTRPGEEPTRPGEEPTRPGEEPTRPGEEPTRPGEEPTRPGDATQVERGGFWNRFVGVLIDALILTIPFMLVSRFASDGGDFLLGMAYFVGFWAIWGATPGKRLLGLSIERPDGSRIGPGRAVARYFAWLLSFLLFGVGFIMAGLREDKRGLHDLICDTVVVQREPVSLSEMVGELWSSVRGVAR